MTPTHFFVMCASAGDAPVATASASNSAGKAGFGISHTALMVAVHIPGQKQGAHLAFLHGPWYRILKRSGIENLRIHDLRHSFASRALALARASR